MLFRSLWQFPLLALDTGESARLLLKTTKPVGYQAWIDSETVALFVLGDTNTLHIVNVRSEEDEKVIGEIGRSLHKTPGRNSVSFVHKVSKEEWWVKEYDRTTKTIHPLIRTFPSREDFAWTPDGTVLMADSLKLYSWKSGIDSTWQQRADYSGSGISEISRLAVSPQGNKIAIVGRMPSKR